MKIEKGNPNAIYEFIGKIGKGGMSTVYKAQHKQTGEIVAIKHISTGNEELRKRVFNEIGIMQLSAHPNIIQYKACFEQGK